MKSRPARAVGLALLALLVVDCGCGPRPAPGPSGGGSSGSPSTRLSPGRVAIPSGYQAAVSLGSAADGVVVLLADRLRDGDFRLARMGNRIKANLRVTLEDGNSVLLLGRSYPVESADGADTFVLRLEAEVFNRDGGALLALSWSSPGLEFSLDTLERFLRDFAAGINAADSAADDSAAVAPTDIH